MAIVLIGLTIKKYKEPAPWKKGANFAQLLSEDEEGNLGKGVYQPVQLRRNTELDKGTMNKTPPVDGGYIESVSPTIRSASKPEFEGTATNRNPSRIIHPTLRKETFESRQSARTVANSTAPAPTSDPLDEDDLLDLEPVYPVAGGSTNELVVMASDTAELATAKAARTQLQLDGHVTNETQIDAVTITGTRSMQGASTSDGVGLTDGSAGESTVEEFEEVKGALDRQSITRQSLC